jgi:hypothetical protein
MGRFSSDRAIREYAADIWRTPSVGVRLQAPQLGPPFGL